MGTISIYQAATIRATMPTLCEEAKKLLGQHVRPEDAHHDVCSTLANRHALWEGTPATGQNLPMWLMYLVSGVMRDLGVSS